MRHDCGELLFAIIAAILDTARRFVGSVGFLAHISHSAAEGVLHTLLVSRP